MNQQSSITLQVTIKAPVEKCWQVWTTPADILQFNNPLPGWHTAAVEINFKMQGRLFYRMEKLDGSEGFDFGGYYDNIIPNKLIEYTGDDGRKVTNSFTEDGEYTIIAETFEPDKQTPLDLQQQFIQGILDSFKNYVENKSDSENLPNSDSGFD